MANLKIRRHFVTLAYDQAPDDGPSSEIVVNANFSLFEGITPNPSTMGTRVADGSEPAMDWEIIVVSSGGSGSLPRYVQHRSVVVPNADIVGSNEVVDIDNFFQNVGTGLTVLSAVARSTMHGEVIYDVFFSYNTQSNNNQRLTVVQADDLTGTTDIPGYPYNPDRTVILERNRNGTIVYDIISTVPS